jgi:hypothetical protein
VVHVDIAPVRRWRGYGFIAVAAILVISVLLLLARSVENSAQFSRWQLWILGANIAGVIVLAVLLARKLRQLVRDYRHHVPGSRLTARTVAMFGALVVVPLLVIYLFSLEFLNRGIDSWFRVEIKQGLDEAVVLSRSALDLRMREQARRTEALAASLREYSNAALAAALDAERRTAAARELIAFGPNGEVIAASVDARELLIDPQIPREMLMQVRGNRALHGSRAAERWRLSHLHGRADSGFRARDPAAIPRGAAAPAARTGGSGQRRAARLQQLRRALVCARAAEIPVPAGADAGAAAGHAVCDLSCDPFGAAAHQARARPHPGHARGGQG